MLHTLLILSLLVIVALLFWPEVGVVSRWREARRRLDRRRREDALKHILKCEVNGQVPTISSVAGALHVRLGAAATQLANMERQQFVSHADGRLRLRPAGRELALHIVRAHRLWESHLAEQTGVDEAKWHRLAERKEHQLSPEQVDALAARLGHPTHDPHGDVIPPHGGELDADRGRALNMAPINLPVEIVHIEDEPEEVYAQLLALGLQSGMRVCVLAKEKDYVRLWAEGRELVLTPMQANNIGCVTVPGASPADLFEEEYLADLRLGERARVLHLTAACRGAERRRLLDLGFVPGTEIEVDMMSPVGDPTAYRVRGTVIALRREQARLIRIGHRQTVTEIATA